MKDQFKFYVTKRKRSLWLWNSDHTIVKKLEVRDHGEFERIGI